MKSLRILVVEDEMIIARDLTDILKQLGHVVVGTVKSAEQALNLLENNEIDLALLDIYIKGDSDGIWLANHLNDNFKKPFLFITSHSDERTLEKAKATGPNGYILKPFEDDDVRVAIEMAMVSFDRLEEVSDLSKMNDSVLKDSIFVKDRSTHKKIMLSDIYYIKADSNYSLVHTKKRSYTLRATLKEIEDKLPDTLFLRVHKSYVINLTHIDEINGVYVVINEQEIPVSREVHSQIINQINKI